MDMSSHEGRFVAQYLRPLASLGKYFSTGLLPGAVIAAAVFLAAGKSTGVSGDVQASVRSSEFVLCDADGKQRARLGFSPESKPTLDFYSSDGDVVVSIGVIVSAKKALWANEPETARRPGEGGQLMLREGRIGSISIREAWPHPGVYFDDHDGKQQIRLWSEEGHYPELALLDVNETIRASLSLFGKQPMASQLLLCGPKKGEARLIPGHDAITLRVQDDGTSITRLSDESNNEILGLVGRADGKAFLTGSEQAIDSLKKAIE